MRVQFDEQIFLLQRHGGVSRYFVDLIRAFEADPALGVTIDVPFARSWNVAAVSGLGGRQLTEVAGPLAPYPDLLRAMARRRRASPSIDLLHHTFYQGRFLRDAPGVPKVVTIYDMIPELLGERGRFGNPHMAKREYVRRADLVLAISESARRDLVDVYGEPAAPVVVTHLGVDARFRPGAPRPAGLPERFVLFVGRRSGYKDFATLLAAFSTVARTEPDLHLVAVGGGPITSAEREALQSQRVSERVTHLVLNDDDLVGAYGSAQAFVFPSRYEGFGLPALEAMACGAPTILADTSSLPEVGGSAALYFPPGDAGALAELIRTVLSSTSLRSELSQAGIARAAHFTWAATARATSAAYQTLC